MTESTMRGLYLGAERDASVAPLPRPSVGARDVRVRVRACGLCGSDLAVYTGRHPFRRAPVVLGHEVAGEVTEIGGEVSVVAVGDRVAVEPQITCGECPACTAGTGNLCARKRVVGVDFPGMLSEEIAVPETVVYPLADHVEWSIGAIAEPLAVAVRALRTYGDCLGRRVAVLGAGAIGGLLALLARHGGAGTLLVTDVRRANLGVVADLTGAEVVAVDRDCATERGRELTDGAGFDAVFVAAGAEPVLAQAQQLCRKGGTIVAVALFGQPVALDVDTLVTSEVTLRGTSMYTPDDFATAVDLINHGALDVAALISHRVELGQAPGLLREMVDGADHMKVTVVL